MIEKLKTPKSINWSDTGEGLIQRHTIINNAYEKINELVDAVNKLDALLDLTNTAIQAVKNEEPADPYAEQRKWIGKLCWFWDDDKKDGSYGILGYIKEGWKRCYVQKGHYFAYEHCEPASEDLIYKGGNNE